MKIYASKYINFTKTALKLVRASRIPKYFSKYSNKIFSNIQHLVLLFFKQRERKDYRSFVEWLKFSKLPGLLRLKRIPHFTTLQKFAKKIKPSLLKKLFRINKAIKAAVDSTGFELDSKSYYYRTIWHQQSKNRSFMKLSVSADADTQLVLRYKLRRKIRHDSLDFKPLLKGLNVSVVLADKGYDSRDLRKFVLRELEAQPQIPFRSISGRDGYYQSIAAQVFDEKVYHQRSKVETIFSVIKRKYGSVLRSRSFLVQEVELVCRLAAYNIDRMVNLFLFLIKGFYRARKISMIWQNTPYVWLFYYKGSNFRLRSCQMEFLLILRLSFPLLRPHTLHCRTTAPKPGCRQQAFQIP